LRWCYALLTYLLCPFALVRLLWRSRRQPAYRLRWRERFGFYAKPREPAAITVVFHAVSVGEVHAAKPLIDAFVAARPDCRIVVTCATPTGSARVKHLFGDRVQHVYLPWDLPGATRRFIRYFQPAMLVLLETELWPSLLNASAEAGCQVVLANARLSEKSQRGYARIGGLTRRMLGQLALVTAQSEADGKRFVSLGLNPQTLRINGSLKFDHRMNPELLARARQTRAQFGDRPVWIAASTREGEDAKVLDAFAQAIETEHELLLILVPRHPERFRLAESLAKAQGLRVQCASKGADLLPQTQVLVGDTMGELTYYYALADVAFVGGSLVDTGCQNVIEPAALGLPVLIGPSRYNFQGITDELIEAQALQIVDNSIELGHAVVSLVELPGLRQSMGERAKQVVARNQGATERLCKMLTDLLASSPAI